MRFPAHHRTQAFVALAMAMATAAAAKEPAAPEPAAEATLQASPEMSEGAQLVAVYHAALAAGLTAGTHGQDKALPAGPAGARLLEAAKLAAEIATLEAQKQAAGLEPGRQQELALSRERLVRLIAELDGIDRAAGGAR